MNFIVRLFPEITIKSPPVRKRWTKHLTENLRTLSRRIHEKASVIQEWDRLEVRVPSEDDSVKQQMIDLLARTPGIANFSYVRAHPFSTMHDIYELTFDAWKDGLSGKTFCVRVKRSGKHDYTSTEIEQYVGGGLNQNCDTAGVKLKDPDVTVNLEVKDQTCYIVEQKYEGLGGFPVGTQDSVLSLVSGGFDSTVASYMMIRRGLRTHYCFFNLGGRDHELGVKEIAFYLWNRYGSSHRVRFITVPFEGVVSEILQKINPSNMGVVLKRMMFRAADKVAEKGGIQALVTGEAIAQVSSQTITNLSVIDSVTDKLVLRPLIVMDKPDIIKTSREIGAEEFSANIPEYCGVISVKPSSKVKVERVEKEEAGFDFGKLEEAIANSQVQAIDEVMDDVEQRVIVPEVQEVSDNQVIVDIRHPHEREMRPLSEEFEVVEIPFYSLSTEFSKLDKNKQYCLFCDKGVMSKLHTAHLIDEGYQNVLVYRPNKK